LSHSPVRIFSLLLCVSLARDLSILLTSPQSQPFACSFACFVFLFVFLILMFLNSAFSFTTLLWLLWAGLLFFFYFLRYAVRLLIWGLTAFLM
jgi:hypothetical protein